MREALAICLERRHLRRTLRIALVVGLVLTAINQLDVIVRGDATAPTGVKIALNFCVPFVVSNLGGHCPLPCKAPAPPGCSVAREAGAAGRCRSSSLATVAGRRAATAPLASKQQRGYA